MLPFLTPLQFNDYTARGKVSVRKIDHKRSYGTSVAKISIQLPNSNISFLALVPMNWVIDYLPGGKYYNVGKQ